MEKNKPIKICNTLVYPGEKVTLALPTPELYTCIPMHIPIHVIHGKHSGPVLIISAAIYGDEVIGISIIQKLIKVINAKSLCGTIIAIPVVNVYGLLFHTRNLPDNRDLRYSFPGSKIGSFASRLAYLLNQEIFSLASVFIDIHSGDLYQTALSQIITNINLTNNLEIAKVFQSRVIVHSENANIMHQDNSKPTFVYKAGEAWRIEANNVAIGVNGIVRIMNFLKMIKVKNKLKKCFVPKIIKNTIWVRSPGSGMNKSLVKLGSYVKKNQKIVNVSDPFGTLQKDEVVSPIEGIVISINNFPLLNEGDYLIEIAQTIDDNVESYNIPIEHNESIEI